MTVHIVILGGGTGGTLTANRLRRRSAADDVQITVVDHDDRHVYQPGLLFVPFGLAHPDDIVPARAAGNCTPASTSPSARSTTSTSSTTKSTSTTAPSLDYDVLVVATGAALVPEETEGLTGPGLDGEGLHLLRPRGRRRAGRERCATFDGGRLVVNVVDMPIKCPVAPLEFCFLADWYFRERGIRDGVEITYVTPLDGAFTKPAASEAPRRHAGRARASSW